MNSSDSISRPSMRAELIEALRQLADADYQQTVWRSDAMVLDPEGVGSLGETINYFDDVRLFTGATAKIGDFLRDEDEAKAIDALTAALEAVLEECGRTADEDALLDSVGWPTVVARAQAALGALAQDAQ